MQDKEQITEQTTSTTTINDDIDKKDVITKFTGYHIQNPKIDAIADDFMISLISMNIIDDSIHLKSICDNKDFNIAFDYIRQTENPQIIIRCLYCILRLYDESTKVDIDNMIKELKVEDITCHVLQKVIISKVFDDIMHYEDFYDSRTITNSFPQIQKILFYIYKNKSKDHVDDVLRLLKNGINYVNNTYRYFIHDMLDFLLLSDFKFDFKTCKLVYKDNTKLHFVKAIESSINQILNRFRVFIDDILETEFR